MPRRYRRVRRSRPLKTVKYSNETYNFSVQTTNPNPGTEVSDYIAMITPVSTQGTRKCKNFTLTIANNADPFFWALVYVPQGTTPSPLNIGTINNEHMGAASLYEPNQNVILSGVANNSSTPGADLTVNPRGITVISRTRLARNLNSGDYIAFVYRSFARYTDANSGRILAMVQLNYAISF